MGRLDGLMLWELINIEDKIPTAQDVAKAIVEEEAKRREDEKAYWEAWDKAAKNTWIEKLRQDAGGSLFDFRGQAIYPHLTPKEEAALIERGELKLVIPTVGVRGVTAIWADSSRDEAQEPRYKELLKIIEDELSQGISRVVD